MNDRLEANKRVVRDWHAVALDQRQPEEAAAKHLGPYYRQHNPNAADGAQAYIGFMKWLSQTYPEFRMETKRIIAEGDYVVLHSHMILKPGDRRPDFHPGVISE